MLIRLCCLGFASTPRLALRIRFRTQSAQRFGPGQRLDRLNEVPADEEELEVDRTAAALATAAAVKNFFDEIDREAIGAAADRTGADELAARLAELGTVRDGDRNHVHGAGLLD